MGKIRVGVSGWSYPEWRGDFYPQGVGSGDELAYLGERFDTVEVNGTFYSLTDPASCRRWYEATPAGFRFAVKGGRFITHNKRLDVEGGPLANFFASGILELSEKLGPILWQLPADLHFDPETVDRFLSALPRDSREAAAIARRHDARVKNPSYGDDSNHRMRHVIEFRNDTFIDAEMARHARRRGVAICISHSAEWPMVEEITAGFVYVRMHGPDELYASEYGEGMLRDWADRLEVWRRGGDAEDGRRISQIDPPRRKERDVYVYFDNTASGHAPRDAERLVRLVADRAGSVAPDGFRRPTAG